MKKLMSKKLTKTLALAACAILLVVGTVMGTVAYLTDSEGVTNTFTYGKVDITLSGSDNGVAYKLIPGAECNMNAKITVKSGSEECFLFAEVSNVAILPAALGEGWTKVSENNNTILYRYDDTVNAQNSDVEVPVLKSFTYSALAENPGDSTPANATVTVIGYAVQATGFDTAADAWAATFGATLNG